MKRMLMFLMVSVASMSLSGCLGVHKLNVAVPAKVDKETNFSYRIEKEPEGEYRVVYDRIKGHSSSVESRILSESQYGSPESIAKKRKVFYAYLKAAAQGTKDMGYNYFVLTNPEVNGFSGFPINNYEQLMRYITLVDRKPHFSTVGERTSTTYRDLIQGSGYVDLRFVPVSKKVYDSGIYAVWKVSDFIKE